MTPGQHAMGIELISLMQQAFTCEDPKKLTQYDQEIIRESNLRPLFKIKGRRDRSGEET